MIFLIALTGNVLTFAEKNELQMDYMQKKMNYKWTTSIAILSATVMFASCNGENGNATLKTTANTAIAYRAYLLDIRSRTDLSTLELASELRRWQVLDDSVTLHLQRDTLSLRRDTRNECDLLHDSIRSEFCRLTRTYNDMLFLKEYLSPYSFNEELLQSVDEIEPFFESVSRQSPFTGNYERTVEAYRNILRRTLGQGIHGTEDLRLFIREEDAVFRAFLTHLTELEQMNVADIMRDTERCCLLVFQAAEREELSNKEAMVYMAMRTNRRLSLNVQQCVKDIRAGKARSAEQAQAYIWMLLQPYTTLDAFNIALLTTQERKVLHRVANDIPNLIDRLGNDIPFNKEYLGDIPSLLMQAYISTL